MASPDLYGALVTYLDGDAGDVRASVNAEQAAILAAGSVTFSRAPARKGSPGRTKLKTTVDITPLEQQPEPRSVGPGFVEWDYALDMRVEVRLKDTPKGKTQLSTLQSILRALAFRYGGIPSLVIPVATGTATFRWVEARVLSVDEDPEERELVQGVVRTTFTFSGPQGDAT